MKGGQEKHEDKNMDNQGFVITHASIEATMTELYDTRKEVKDWMSQENIPKISSAGGIYAFWRAGTEEAIYIGRTKNIRARFKQHLLCKKNQSPLACKLAKESLAKEEGGEEGKKYLLPHYGSSDDKKIIREEIEKRLERNDIEEYMKAMGFSFYLQEDTVQQCMAEVFFSTGLNTINLSEEGDEEDNIKKVEEDGKFYYRYRFYNSFRTS